MKKSGRMFVLASWLIVRLRWAMQAAIEKSRPVQPVSIIKLTASGAPPERWHLDSALPMFVGWSSSDRSIHVRQLPLIVPN